jgi:hypothetical protein
MGLDSIAVTAWAMWGGSRIRNASNIISGDFLVFLLARPEELLLTQSWRVALCSLLASPAIVVLGGEAKDSARGELAALGPA